MRKSRYKKTAPHEQNAQTKLSRISARDADVNPEAPKLTPDPPNWVEKGTLAVLILAFFAAAYAGYEARRLADSTDSSIVAADTAAKKQRAISIDTEQRQLRAYIQIRSGTIKTIPKSNGVEVTVNPMIRVYGQTPAGAVTPQWEITVFDWPMTDNTKFPSYLMQGSRLESNVTYAPGEDRPLGAKTKLITNEELEAIKSGKQALYAIGTILYVDIFRIPRYTNFCFAFDINGMDTGNATECAIHNGADWNNSLDPYTPVHLHIPMK